MSRFHLRFLQYCALALMIIAGLLLRQQLETLLTVVEREAAALLNLILPLLLLSISLSLISIISCVEGNDRLGRITFSVLLGLLPIVIFIDQPLVTIVIPVVFALSYIGLNLTLKRQKNELLVNPANFDSGMTAVLFAISLFLSLGLGLLTARIAQSGQLSLPPALINQIGSYTHLTSQPKIETLISDLLTRLGSLVPISAVLSYLIIFSLITPVISWLFAAASTVLTWLLRRVGWLTISHREASQQAILLNATHSQ